MTNNKTVTVRSNRSWGDVALDGLWPGIVGGLLMMAYLVLVGLLQGDRPTTVLSAFVPEASLSPLAGLGTHLAVSAVHGTIFGLLTAVLGRWIPNGRPLAGAGLLYGLLLWLMAWLVIIPSGLSGLGSISIGHLLVAHLVFGGVLGRQVANSRLSA